MVGVVTSFFCFSFLVSGKPVSTGNRFPDITSGVSGTLPLLEDEPVPESCRAPLFSTLLNGKAVADELELEKKIIIIIIFS